MLKKNKRCCVYTATGNATIDTAEPKGIKLNFSGNILGKLNQIKTHYEYVDCQKDVCGKSQERLRSLS